ncbi:MAG: type IX secretion system membrane protein PorP/SprF [Cytophagales bacterium]|nr:MAG: type IX secretion system membrane protein PorP/SprF [Cytophagales bacterium]
MISIIFYVVCNILVKIIVLKSNKVLFIKNIALKKLVFIVFLCHFVGFLFAQDPHFSQSYASPMYLNPALTGTTLEGRFTFNYRTQFPRLPGEFVTTQIGYEHYLSKIRSGIGISVLTDKAGSAGFKSTSVMASYAYNLFLNKESGLRGGMQVGVGQRSMDNFKLLFGDQITPLGATNSASAELGLPNLTLNYVDVNAGLAYYTSDFWIGVSGHHLNEPNFNFIAQKPEKLPMRISVQAGLSFRKYEVKKDKREEATAAFTPMIYYSRQGIYQQLDIGANLYRYPILLGFFYRAVPIINNYYGALVTQTGFTYNTMTFLYSFDMGIGQFARNTGGAHEISVLFRTSQSKQIKRKYKRKGSNYVAFPSMLGNVW